MPDRNRRLGPIEAAIQARDRDALLHALSARTRREPTTGCLRWTGNRRPNGYGMVGRGPTNHLTHRLVAWADAGFPGELRGFPPVHHLCGTRDCIEGTHLASATSLINALEASVRTTALRRIRELEDAIRALQPDHPALDYPEFTETPLPLPRSGRVFETPRERLKRKEAADALARKRSENANHRFRQVLEVQQLIGAGATERHALATVGIHRRVYQHWAGQLTQWMEKDAA
jgi:hypothetical protein